MHLRTTPPQLRTALGPHTARSFGDLHEGLFREASERAQTSDYRWSAEISESPIGAKVRWRVALPLTRRAEKFPLWTITSQRHLGRKRDFSGLRDRVSTGRWGQGCKRISRIRRIWRRYWVRRHRPRFHASLRRHITLIRTHGRYSISAVTRPRDMELRPARAYVPARPVGRWADRPLEPIPPSPLTPTESIRLLDRAVYRTWTSDRSRRRYSVVIAAVLRGV